MLETNMELLNKHSHQLAQKFSLYVAKKIIVSPTEKRDLIVDGESFYGMDAHLACVQQVEHFIKQPISHSVSYKSDEHANTGHQRVINALNAQAHEADRTTHIHAFQTLIILGAAYGFHLPLLLDRLEVNHVILVEPDDDMLFHCFENIDLRAIEQKCQAKGGMLTIVQPKSEIEFGEQLSIISREWGCGFLANIAMFRHYQTDTFDSIFENIRTLRNQCLSGWGFLEDEIIGVKHTLTNIDEGVPFFNGKQCSRGESYALIIGNGPSLDAALPMLRRVHKNATLISCGSATGTLLKAGIVPHVHAEMERSDNQFTLNKHWLHPEITDKILLIALNTVSPLLLRAFKHKRLFAKANDLGASLLAGEGATSLYFCNPTATNFACSASIQMGWKKIALIGCDYGYKNVMQHHASQSDYFNPKSVLSKAQYRAELTLKANFGGKVYSQRIYNLSRINIELLLRKHQDIDAFNTSDGAHIEGARPTPLNMLEDAIRLSDPGACENTDEPTASLLMKSNKILYDIDGARLNNVIDSVEQFVDLTIREFEKSRTIQDISATLARLNRLLENQHNRREIYLLFSGVLKFFHVAIQGHTTRMNMESQSEYFRLTKKEVKAYFEQCLTFIQRLYEERNTYEI